VKFAHAVKLLQKRMPTDFPCDPGCVACCKNHAWTWEEWDKVNDKRYAASIDDPCPYASDKGCECYEHRPLICRLYGNAWEIEYGGQTKISVHCPVGVKPNTIMSNKEASGLFRDIMQIIHGEAADMASRGCEPLFAGPYGQFTERRQK
jgi:Fe-S-cluster containining protein